MPLSSKPIKSLTEVDLRLLIANGVREQQTLEYKLTLPGERYKDKKEFLADVSSFANTHGGHLLFGVRAVDGKAAELVGIDDALIDTGTQRLESLMRHSLKPPLISAEIHPIRLATGKTILLFRVGRSWNLPHRVTLEGHDHFYGRSTSGKYSLDVPELRALFNLSGSLSEQVRSFRADRLGKIASNETPASLPTGPKTVLHIVPFGAFLPGSTLPTSIGTSLSEWSHPIGRRGGSRRLNFDGMLTSYKNEDTGLAEGYIQVFRNGCIEALDARMIGKHNGELMIPSKSFEEEIIKAVGAYLSGLAQVGVQPPLVIMLSLLNVQGCRMLTTEIFNYPRGYPIDRNSLLVPEIVIETLNIEADKSLRQTFDAIWNACGYSASPNYNADGNCNGTRGNQ